MTLNKILRWVVTGGVFLIGFVPLVVFDSFLFPFISGKAFFFRIIVEIILAAWLVLIFRDKTYWPKVSSLLKSVAILVVVVAIADWLSPNSFKSFWSNFERMEGFVTIIHLFAYFVVAGSILKTEKLWHWLFHTPIATGVFLFFFSVVQLKGELAIDQGGIRVDGTLGNATYLAGFLVFVLFLLLFFLSRRHEKRFPMIITSWLVGSGLFLIYPFYTYFGKYWDAYNQLGGQLPEGFHLDLFTGPIEGRLLWLAVAILVIFSILLSKSRHWSEMAERRASISLYLLTLVLFLIPFYYTATRGTQAGLIIGLAVMAVIIILFDKGHARLRQWCLGLLGVSVLALVLVLVFHKSISQADLVKKSPVLSRYGNLLEEVVSLDKTKICQGELKSRCMIWPMAWQGFKEKPIFGWGQESFNYVFNKYYNPNLHNQEQWFDRAHNVFFDWLIAGGILGLLSYLSLYVILLVLLWRPREGHPLGIIEKAILSGLVVAYFVHNFFVFDNLTSYLLFFTLLAYAHSELASGEILFERLGKIDVGLRDRIVTPIILVVFIGVIYFVNVPAMRAGNNLIDALLTRREGFSKNFEYYKAAISQHSFADSEIREQLFQRSLQLMGNDTIDAGLKNDFLVFTRDQLLEQLKVSPDDARYQFFTGVFFLQAGLPGQAEPFLEKAHELSPSKQMISINLVATKVSLGKLSEAIEIAKTAYEEVPAYRETLIVYAAVALYNQQNDIARKLLVDAYGTEIIADSRLVQAYEVSGQPNKAAAVKKLLAGS